MPQILQIAAIAIATVGTGAATMTVMKDDMPDFAVPEGNWTPGEVLDGKTFRVDGSHIDKPENILKDELIFREGQFLSANCQDYCDFGWSNYQTKIEGDVIHFTTTTTCPDAPHTVVFYGTVTGDTIEVKGTWTTRRWYWTRQIAFAVSGTPEEAPVATDAG